MNMQIEIINEISSSGIIIAEIAQAHEGSLGTAYAMIDAAATAGADAVKFQTHIASMESTLDEPWRIKFSYQDETRFDYWHRMEFTPDQWAGIAEHVRKKGMIFLSSPFSAEAVKLLDRLDMPAWKVPSGEIGNIELLEAILETNKPILFSTGLCTLAELDAAVVRATARNVPFAVFQCTSEYPCSPEHWGLNMIAELQKRYDCLVGFSDHSGTPAAGMAAVALGASFIEVHVTFSRGMFGPDVSASITFEELAELARGVKQIRSAITSPVDKDEMALRKKDLRSIFGRSWALRKDLPAGTTLLREHLSLKKPGTGIPYDRINDIVGKKLKSDKSALHLLSRNDFE